MVLKTGFSLSSSSSYISANGIYTFIIVLGYVADGDKDFVTVNRHVFGGKRVVIGQFISRSPPDPIVGVVGYGPVLIVTADVAIEAGTL